MSALHRWGKAWSRVKEYKWKCQGCGSSHYLNGYGRQIYSFIVLRPCGKEQMLLCVI